MKRIFGSLSKRSSPSLNSPSEYPDDSPEGTILKAVVRATFGTIIQVTSIY